MRESPEVMDMILGDAGHGIVVIRPCHPSEDVWVELLDTTIDAVLKIVKVFSDVVAEANPREYKQSEGDTKVWKMGSGRSAVLDNGVMKYIRQNSTYCGVQRLASGDMHTP